MHTVLYMASNVGFLLHRRTVNSKALIFCDVSKISGSSVFVPSYPSILSASHHQWRRRWTASKIELL